MTTASDDSSRKEQPQPAQPWPERILSLLWGFSKLAAVVYVFIFILVARNDIWALIPRVSRIEALGVKVEVSQLQSALERQQAESVKSSGVVIRPGAVEEVLARALRVQTVFQGAAILWIDDSPSSNLPFRQVLRTLGAGVEPARSTAEALELASVQRFDLVVSDIKRVEESGIEGLVQLRAAGVTAPAIFYVLQVDRGLPVPDTALGITNSPDELLHLVIDGLERARWSTPEAAEQPVSADGATHRR